MQLDLSDPFEALAADLVRLYRLQKVELRDFHRGEHECQEDSYESKLARFEVAHPGCCPRCGWSLTSHAKYGMNLNCPWGRSPAAKDGTLPGYPPKS